MKLYAVSVDKAQDVTKVKPVVDASSWEYEVLLDPNGDFQRAMGAANVPHVVVVDGNGKIVESHSGYTEGSEDHLFEIIRELVNKKVTVRDEQKYRQQDCRREKPYEMGFCSGVGLCFCLRRIGREQGRRSRIGAGRHSVSRNGFRNRSRPLTTIRYSSIHTPT